MTKKVKSYFRTKEGHYVLIGVAMVVFTLAAFLGGSWVGRMEAKADMLKPERPAPFTDWEWESVAKFSVGLMAMGLSLGWVLHGGVRLFA